MMRRVQAVAFAALLLSLSAVGGDAATSTKASSVTSSPAKNQQRSIRSIESTSAVPSRLATLSDLRGGARVRFGRAGSAEPVAKVEAAATNAGQKKDDGIKKASIPTSVFNLANNVAGAGILTLSGAKASGTGWIPSILMSVSLSMCAAHTFMLIAKACDLTDEDSFKGLWTKAFGPKTAFIVDSMVFVQCFCVSVIYTGLLGDVVSALLDSATFNVPSVLASRAGIIVAAAISVLYPLNLIRDLSALGFTSILGLCAVLYTVFFIIVRSLDGTYALGGAGKAVGKFVADSVIAKPDFTKSTMWNIDFNVLVLMANLGLSYIAHYNGPSYWQALDQATVPRFRRVSVCAYAILAILYTATMVAGYATFGDTCQGTILLNYHPSDMLSTLGKTATAASLTFGFPLISRGAREGFKNAMSALGMPAVADPKNHVPLVTIMLCCTTFLAITASDIKLIAGLTGAIMGSSLVYICPTLIYSRIVMKLKGKDSPEYRKARLNLLFVPFGLFVAAMGVTMTLKNTILKN